MNVNYNFKILHIKDNFFEKKKKFLTLIIDADPRETGQSALGDMSFIHLCSGAC